MIELEPAASGIKKRWPLVAVLILTALYASWWSWFSVARHHKLNSTRFDLGNAEQVIWNATQGRWFVSTDPYGTATVSRLAYHADFFLLTLTPIYAVAPAAETLLILQALAVASGVLAVFWLAKHWLHSDGWALGLAAIYAFQPALHWMNLFDFHAVAFATPLILWTMLAAVKKKYGWMFCLAVLAMFTKEEIGFTLLPISAYVWWRHRQRQWAMLMLIPAAWSCVAFAVLIPSAQDSIQNPDNVFRSLFGNSSTQVLVNFIQHPRALWHTLFNAATARYAFELFGPTGFLPIGHWLTLGALPDLTVNLVSDKGSQRTILFHYAAGILPWLMIGLTASLAALRRWWEPRSWLRWTLGIWLTGWLVIGVWAWGPLPGAQRDWMRVVSWWNPYVEPVRHWVKRIPPDSAVSVTNNIGSQFARREDLYSFPLGLEHADYAVVLQGHALPEVATPADVDAQLVLLKQDVQWQVEYQQNELTILRRVK